MTMSLVDSSTKGIACIVLVLAVYASNQWFVSSENCVQMCRSLRDGSVAHTRCVRNVCRDKVFRYYIRFGKRTTNSVSVRNPLQKLNIYQKRRLFLAQQLPNIIIKKPMTTNNKLQLKRVLQKQLHKHDGDGTSAMLRRKIMSKLSLILERFQGRG